MLACYCSVSPLQARKAVEARNNLERKVAHKQREAKEENLRQLAQKARDERAGIRTEGDGMNQSMICVHVHSCILYVSNVIDMM